LLGITRRDLVKSVLTEELIAQGYISLKVGEPHTNRQLLQDGRELVLAVAQGCLGPHAFGRLVDRAQHSADSPTLVADRAVGERKPSLLGTASARECQREVFEVAGFPLHRPLGNGADDVPRFGPDLRKPAPERLRLVA
jgi:hypothetical protein